MTLRYSSLCILHSSLNQGRSPTATPLINYEFKIMNWLIAEAADRIADRFS